MPNQFNSPEGDLENYFVSEYWLIDQWVGDTLWSWGENSVGQMGANTATNRSTPVTTFAGGTNWKQVAGGSQSGHTAAIKTDGTLWTWGYNAYGSLGDNTTVSRSTPVTTFAGGTNWKQVAGGRFHTAAVKTDGTLWTWGRNNFDGQLGVNDLTNRLTPVTTFAGGTNWKQVACGYSHNAAVKTDGTLWTWGDNTLGQLGDNTTTDKRTPVTTFAGGTNWKQVACGSNHTAAIKNDGTLWNWGSGGSGQLGDRQTVSISGSMTNESNILTTSNTSGVVVGMSVISTSPGNGAMLQLGTVTNVSATTITFTNNYPPSVVSAVGTWSNFGGLNTSVDYRGIVQPYDTVASWNPSSPAPPYYMVSDVSANFISFFDDSFAFPNGQTYTVTFSRTVGNFSGTVVLGFSSYSGAITPVTTLVGGTNWKQVAGGSNHTAAIKTDGTLWTWGSGVGLGDNIGGTRYTPVTTFAGGTNWKQVAGGRSHTAAVKTDGTLWTWGNNYRGNLGVNDLTTRLTPVTTFAGGTNWKQVACGSNHTAAVTSGTDPTFFIS